MGLPAHYRIQLRLTSDSEEDRATVPSSCSADRTKRDAGRLRLTDRHSLDLRAGRIRFRWLITLSLNASAEPVPCNARGLYLI